MKKILPMLLAALSVCAAMPAAQAQSYPARSVRVLIPYPPGGTADLLARLLGARLAETLGQPFVIENRAGAGGNPGRRSRGTRHAGRLHAADGERPGAGREPQPVRKAAFRSGQDFAPVSLVANVPLLLLVNPAFPARSAADIIAAARAQPGKVNYASADGGSTTYLATELFKSMAGVQLQAIPYKGSGPALSALVSGEVPIMFELFPSALGHVRGGPRARLAVTSPARSPLMPELPTVAETGLPGYEIASWFGIVAPAGTPREAVTRLNAEIVRLIASPEMRERLATPGRRAAQQFARSSSRN
ncbi:MAG: tripartite tricarboxylate transporter substrate binding protein [Betaproteobacteria bacterium]|nr:tripartite tricarboxylate transporter substrate binding protein [Betaproteobacteria bacterium]